MFLGVTLSRITLLALTCLAFGLVSCASRDSGNGATITKVNPYHITQEHLTRPIADRAVSFERDHYMYGAITGSERATRYGDYYTIFWNASERNTPMKVRLEYIKRHPDTNVKVIEQEIPRVKRRNVTKFAINGKDYFDNGPVLAWRASLLRDGQVVDHYDSYLWR